MDGIKRPEGLDLSKVPKEAIEAYMKRIKDGQVASKVSQPSRTADEITREYIDKLLLEARYIDSTVPDVNMELFGKSFQTPIMTGALSHTDLVTIAQGAKTAGAVMWCGMGSEEELREITATGAETIKIIKPYRDDRKVMEQIRIAEECGVLAVGMDIDHAFNFCGEPDSFGEEEYGPKTKEELASFVRSAHVPFVIKGVLSVSDAKKCKEIGAAGIVVSHHNGRLPYAVPPMMILPEIREAVGDEMKVFVDCSLHSGVDAYKAIALGADACSYGRHLKNVMQENGADGVAREIGNLTNQLKQVMAMTGCAKLAQIDKSVIHNLN